MKRLLTITTILLLTVSCGKYDQRGDIAAINDRLANHDTRLDDITTRLDTYIMQVDTNTQAITDLGVDLDTLQANIDVLAQRIQDLEDEPRIIQVKRPCETSKEILLELDTGEMIAYFEQGSNRYLSILGPGTYITTDNTNCTFTVE